MTTLVLPTDAPLVIGPPQGQWTYADWETLPEDGNRYEIIDGVLYMTTAPGYFHQWILYRLAFLLGVPVNERGLGYAVFAPIGLLMPGSDPVQPDFVIVLKAHQAIIHDKRIYGIPDLIIEVQSPGNASYDQHVKLRAYETAGVPEYGIVDPAARTLSVYRLERTAEGLGQYAQPRVFSAADTMHFDCLPTLVLTVGDLFVGSPDTTL